MNISAKAGCLFVLVLSACAELDDVKPLQTTVPTNFMGQAVQSTPRVDYEWWRLFGDANLDKIVNIAIVENPTLKQAKARVREAEALARTFGDWPIDSLDVNIGTPRDSAEYDAELELFGDRRQRGLAAQARAEAAEFNSITAHVQLISQLSQVYVELRFLQKVRQLSQLDLQSRTRTLESLRALASEGNATRLDIVRAQSLVAETRSRLAENAGAIAGQKQLLSTLMGRPFSISKVDVKFHGSQPLPTRILEVGVPADLIRNNSSIKTAEKLYVAAVRELGAAKRARYPSLSLSGAIFKPLEGGSSARSGLLSVVLPIFQQPLLAAEQDAASARADQAYAQWTNEVLTAIQEVESALAGISAAQASVTHTERQVNLTTEALGLTRELAEIGEVTAIELLDSERDVTQARLSNALAQRDFAQNVVLLYRALGVGVPTEISNSLKGETESAGR